MRQHIQIAAIVALAGACVPALAQDSISNAGGGLPGDALYPDEQNCSAYVVDLSPIISTQGHVFGAAPILKTQKWDPAFFNNLPSTSAISPDVLVGVPYARSTYQFWNTPGSGINGKMNNFGQFVNPTGESTQFAVVQGNFGGGTLLDNSDAFNGVIGALVNFDPADANRLFVDRYHAAVNRPNSAIDPSARLGGYSIDANGNLYFVGSAGAPGPNPLTGSNWYRTRLADRNCNVQNIITDLNASSDATDRLVTNAFSLHPAPNMMPASIAGGNGLVGGINFSGQYVYGGMAPLSANNTYVDTTVAGSTRGKLSSTSADLLNAGASHAQSYGQLAKGPAGRTTVFNVHSVDDTGTLITKKAFEIPLDGTFITDNDDGFALAYSTDSQFYTYTGAATFQGVGHIAMGQDQDGRALMASTIMENMTNVPEPGDNNDDWSNQIVVARYDPVADTTEWTFAAYVDQFAIGTPDHGKPIYDAAGVEIGQLVDLLNLTGGAPLGPIMSAPAIDSAGNIWFMGAVELYDRLAPGVSDFDGALLRAIYDPATFSYRLEMVLEVGQQIDGLNSGRKYRINFLGTATNAGTPNPAALWTSNVAEHAWNNSDISGVAPSDPITNGGLVVSTSIIYDTNQDGIFNDPTSAAYDPLSPSDEAYSVLMYIGYYQTEVVDPCPSPADYVDDDVLDISDVFAFLTFYSGGDMQADITLDGLIDISDVFAFLTLYNAGCP